MFLAPVKLIFQVFFDTAANDKSCQILPSKIFWHGTIDRFEVFRNNFESHNGKIGAGCLFDSCFSGSKFTEGY
jgi:hypothetical protein